MDTLELLDQSNPVAASGHDSAWSSLLLRLMGPRLESLQLSGAGPLQLAAVAAMPLLESLDFFYEDTLDDMRPPNEVSLPRTLKVRGGGVASDWEKIICALTVAFSSGVRTYISTAAFYRLQITSGALLNAPSNKKTNHEPLAWKCALWCITRLSLSLTSYVPNTFASKMFGTMG